jgi:putative oxidoreductase
MTKALDRAMEWRRAGRGAAQKAEPVALLLGRLAVGLLFLSTGWGKIHNLEKVTGFFASLLCGAALCVGLLTRLATVPLVVSMIVALATAKRGDIHGLFDLVGQEELTYLVLLVMIAVLGPGTLSIDHLLERAVRGPRSAVRDRAHGAPLTADS